MYLKRAAEEALKDILAGDKVGVILGARQVGKTTLVEHVLAGQPAVFLNFDVEVDKARFHSDNPFAVDISTVEQKADRP
jgi:predicted AAA+ superfamily ATPase